MKYLNRILSIIKSNHKNQTIWVFVFTFLYTIFSIVSLASLMPALGILFGTEEKVFDKPINTGSLSYYKDLLYYELTKFTVESGQIKTLALVCVFVVVMFFFKNLFNYLSMFFLSSIRNGVSNNIRNKIHNKILNLPISYFSDSRKGDILSRASSDVVEIEWTILTSLVSIVRSPIMIIGHIIILIAINAKLTLFAFIVLPLSGFIISFIGKSLKKDSEKAQGELGKLISHIEETLTGLKIIKIFNSGDIMKQKFEQTNKNYENHSNRVLRKRDLASPIGEVIGSIVMVSILWYGGKLIIEGGGMKPQNFLVYLGMFFQMIEPAKKLAQTSSNIQKGSASASRIFEILDTEIMMKDNDNSIAINNFKNKISFDNVNFSYGEENIIHNLNLEISKGQKIALVGQSGGGKSTIANLITRFYDVSSGQISIDGTNIKDIKLNDYRELFGMVTQESIFFNDTVMNNITLGKKYDIKDVIAAAKIANAHEFIEKMPKSYDTNIGDGGGKLSGGQRQRISIARAVLKNPPIMILDEATSALDTESEKLVQEALENLMKGKTSIVIAHRLSTIKSADIIIVMRNGEIVEKGTHNELLSNKKNYFSLISSQSL